MFIMTVAINTGTSSLHIKHRESGGRDGTRPVPPTEPAAAVTPEETHDLITPHSQNHTNEDFLSEYRSLKRHCASVINY